MLWAKPPKERMDGVRVGPELESLGPQSELPPSLCLSNPGEKVVTWLERMSGPWSVTAGAVGR